MPVVLLIGPQGAGKGTQARLLSMLTGWPHVDAGALLRQEALRDTPLGRRIHELISQGFMVPDELITQIILQRLPENAILDGFPRTLQQYELYKDQQGRLDRAVLIHITDDEAVRRLAKRRVCKSQREEWTFIAGDHAAEARCKKAGGRILQREDDQPEAIRERLRLYHERTEPLLHRLREEGLLRVVDGSPPVGSVLRSILHALKDLLGQPIP